MPSQRTPAASDWHHGAIFDMAQGSVAPDLCASTRRSCGCSKGVLDRDMILPVAQGDLPL
jgi:hypothetical protein